MKPIFFTRLARSEKTVCMGMQCGGFSGFATMRYDLRHLLRGAGYLFAALFALRALRVRR